MKRAFARATRSASRSASFIKSQLPLSSSPAGSRTSSRPTGCGWRRIPTTGCRTTTCRPRMCGSNQFEDARQEGRAAVKLAPNSVVAYQQLTRALLALDRLAEARAIIAEADGEGTRLVGAAPVGVRPGVHRQRRRRHAGTPARRVVAAGRLSVVTEAARAAFATGDIDGSRTLYAQAVTAARATRISDIAGSLLAEAGAQRRAPRRSSIARATRAAGRDHDQPRRRDDVDARRWPRRSSARRRRPRSWPRRIRTCSRRRPTSSTRRCRCCRRAIAIASHDGAAALAQLNSAAAVRRRRRPVAAVPARPRERRARATTRRLRSSSSGAARASRQSADQLRPHASRGCSWRAPNATPATPTQARQAYADFTAAHARTRRHATRCSRPRPARRRRFRRRAVPDPMTPPVDVLLVSMPFGPLMSPSLGLSLLQPQVAGARPDLPQRVLHARLRRADRRGAVLARSPTRTAPMSRAFVGEWIFSHALYDWDAAHDERYIAEVLLTPPSWLGRNNTRPPTAGEVRGAVRGARRRRRVRRPRAPTGSSSCGRGSSASPASSSSISPRWRSPNA